MLLYDVQEVVSVCLLYQETLAAALGEDRRVRAHPYHVTCGVASGCRVADGFCVVAIWPLKHEETVKLIHVAVRGHLKCLGCVCLGMCLCFCVHFCMCVCVFQMGL